MRTRTTKVKIYTVVEVWRGMAQSAKSFDNVASAEKYMQRLRKHQNPLDDEAALFKTVLHVKNRSDTQ